METDRGILERIERSFDPSKRSRPTNAGEARALVQNMLTALPSRQARRLRALAWSVDFESVGQEVCYDRIFCALAAAAEAWGTTPELLAKRIIDEKSCVGTLMTQAG